MADEFDSTPISNEDLRELEEEARRTGRTVSEVASDRIRAAKSLLEKVRAIE